MVVNLGAKTRHRPAAGLALPLATVATALTLTLGLFEATTSSAQRGYARRSRGHLA